MAAMSWYHPLLSPGPSELTLVCTVVSCERGPDRYENPYWNVRLRIDERLYVAENFAKRMENVRFIGSGSFNQLKPGERIVFFGGIGEKYFNEDFLKPAWSGTSSDLGIVLRDTRRSDRANSERLLASLRAEAQGAAIDKAALKAFAVFCPKGVARYRELERLHKQLEREALIEAGKDAKK